jgi:hypothetical protein
MIVKVDWDFYNDELGSIDPYGQSTTPTLVEVPDTLIADSDAIYGNDYVSDWLSDEYGWLVSDWEVHEDN